MFYVNGNFTRLGVLLGQRIEWFALLMLERSKWFPDCSGRFLTDLNRKHPPIKLWFNMLYSLFGIYLMKNKKTPLKPFDLRYQGVYQRNQIMPKYEKVTHNNTNLIYYQHIINIKIKALDEMWYLFQQTDIWWWLQAITLSSL